MQHNSDLHCWIVSAIKCLSKDQSGVVRSLIRICKYLCSYVYGIYGPCRRNHQKRFPLFHPFPTIHLPFLCHFRKGKSPGPALGVRPVKASGPKVPEAMICSTAGWGRIEIIAGSSGMFERVFVEQTCIVKDLGYLGLVS